MHFPWKEALKILLIIAIYAVIGVSSYFILRACGLTDMDALRTRLGDSFWTYFCIFWLQVFQVVFIPLSNQLITIPASIAFGDRLFYVFLSSWLGISAGTVILYWIGRCGGSRFINWITSDKEKTARCVAFLKNGRAFYPVGMLLSFIPDDILTTVAGMSGYNFWYVMAVTLVTRAVCVACTVFGYGFLIQYWWGWLILILGTAAVGVLTWLAFKYQRQMDAWLDGIRSRRKGRHKNGTENDTAVRDAR
jgi:uncharacterized membrane protein YdjX (TVP38/TMEM64 family)